MPSSKRQKTVRDSGIFLQSDSEESGSDSPRVHKNDRGALSEISGNERSKAPSPTPQEKGRGGSDVPEKQARSPSAYEYICFNRPMFDVDGANWRDWSDGKAERLDKPELYDKVYKPGFDAETEAGIYMAPPSENKDHKWVIMWHAWLKTDLLMRKAKYCDPDILEVNVCNDWRGWGMQEIVENLMLEFDRGFRQKSENRLDAMWVVVSAMGLWLNEEEHISSLIMNEDSEATCELIGLVGCALLTVLSAIDRAGGLKPDARFLDLPLVIGYYLEVSHDLPAYGIDGKCVSWRREAVALFKKARLDPNKALFDTAQRLEQLENSLNYDEHAVEILGYVPCEDDTEQDEAIVDKDIETPQKKRKRDDTSKTSENDPWGWSAKFKAYKWRRRPVMGGQKYDITKMTRADRAAVAYEGKDPLADVPVKDLKENLLDFSE